MTAIAEKLNWSQINYWNDVTWVWYSNIFMLVPMTIIFFYKLFNPIDYNLLKTPKKHLTRDFGDKFLNIICAYPLFYYVIDAICRIATGGYKTSCGASFLFHHFVALIFLPNICFSHHFPWFWLGPGAAHAYLIAFPHHTWLNYIYLVIIFLFQYGLYQKPFSDLKPYKNMKLGIICIEMTVVCLWWFDCSNVLVTEF